MTDYVPPKVWIWEAPSGGQFASINRPVAGATHDAALPLGDHPLQLYSLGTPNGVKVSILLEELLAAGHSGLDLCDARERHVGRNEVGPGDREDE